MAVYKRGEAWWYRFTWRGKAIRESTKQSNKRLAEQMEAAHKTSLAKGEVGLRDRKPVPTLKDFAEKDFTPFIESRFQDKAKTLEYYKAGIKTVDRLRPAVQVRLGRDHRRQNRRLHCETPRRRVGGRQHQPATGGPATNAEAVRRVGQGRQAPAEGGNAPGENHRDRVLTAEEETRYLNAASAVGDNILDAHRRALEGIRATQRGEEPIEPRDPFLLRDVTTILIDCGLRPEECFRLRWEHVQDGAVHIPFGKTENARRTIPLTQRTAAILEMRRATAEGNGCFPRRPAAATSRSPR